MWKTGNADSRTVQISGVPLPDLETCQLYDVIGFSADFASPWSGVAAWFLGQLYLQIRRAFEVRMKTPFGLTISKKYH